MSFLTGAWQLLNLLVLLALVYGLYKFLTYRYKKAKR